MGGVAEHPPGITSPLGPPQWDGSYTYINRGGRVDSPPGIYICLYIFEDVKLPTRDPSLLAPETLLDEGMKCARGLFLVGCRFHEENLSSLPITETV